MFHQQNHSISQGFVLKTQMWSTSKVIPGYHLGVTVTYLSQRKLNGQMHLLAVWGMVSDTVAIEDVGSGVFTNDNILYLTINCPLTVYLWFCEGGLLASIEDPAEQQFLKTNVEVLQDSHSSFWVGLFKNHQGIIRLFAPAWEKFNKNLLTNLTLTGTIQTGHINQPQWMQTSLQLHYHIKRL